MASVHKNPSVHKWTITNQIFGTEDDPQSLRKSSNCRKSKRKQLIRQLLFNFEDFCLLSLRFAKTVLTAFKAGLRLFSDRLALTGGKTNPSQWD